MMFGEEALANAPGHTLRDHRLLLAVVLFVFCLSLYMLTLSGKLTAADTTSMLATAKSLVQRAARQPISWGGPFGSSVGRPKAIWARMDISIPD